MGVLGRLRMATQLIRIDDPFYGLWKFNPERSHYEFGPMPHNAYYRIDPDEMRLKVTMDWDTTDGQHNHQVYYAVPDGKDHPYTESPAVDYVTTTRIDEHTLDTAAKKDGKVISYASRVLSEDGKLMTVTMSGNKPNGEPYSNIAIYEK
jgi:hypothetical protein